MKQEFPKSWIPSKTDLNAGWKKRSAVLSEIVTAINEDIYIEDESELMETVDVLLEHLKSKYIITEKKK